MTNAISATGLALIQQHEGFRAEPTRLADGNWLVGYSHVRIGEPGEPITESTAAELLALDIAPYETLVNERVSQPLDQAQFDALVSFAFSVGAEAFEQSQVLRRVNAGDLVAAACAMDAWRKAEIAGESVVVDALVRRRAAEKALFLSGMACGAAPSVYLRAKLDYAASVLGAPVEYAPAPEVKHAPEPAPQIAPAERLTEILKSEPATEELLLTQVVGDDVADEEGEIVTAHAKPVARSLDQVREATRAAYAAAQTQQEGRKGLLSFFFKQRERWYDVDPANPQAPVDTRLRSMRARAAEPRDWTFTFENAGLIALLAFGLLLMGLGGSLLFGSAGDLVSIAAAAALVTPGLAATLMAALGLWRGQDKLATA